MEEVVHTFSDASMSPCGRIAAGAYVIGFGGKPTGAILDCARSVDAELAVAAIAISAARELCPECRRIVHHIDLNCVHRLMRSRRLNSAAEFGRALAAVAACCMASVRQDGKKFREHHLCHKLARDATRSTAKELIS